MADEQKGTAGEEFAGKTLEQLAEAAEGVAGAATRTAAGAYAQSATLDLIMEVPLQVTVEVGRKRMTIQDILQLGQGSVVELEKLAGEPLDIYINGRKVATGEAVIVNEKFGVRVSDVVSTTARVEALR